MGDVLARIEERLVIVLPVKIHESRAKVAECSGGGERVVDKRATPALRRYFPSDDDLTTVGELKNGLHAGEVFAGAHEVCAGPATDQEIDGFDDDRLPGSRFSGQDGQPAIELDLQFIDDREMTHSQVAKHGEAGTPIVSNL
jgi:hypothetical protein